jgi:hypothetical protein
MLAKVNINKVTDRECYSFWDGKSYQPHVEKARPVLRDLQHGSVYKSTLFEPNKGLDWVVIGSSSIPRNQNKVIIGASGNIEGPYLTYHLLEAFSPNLAQMTSLNSCVYPHPWAFQEESGVVMITWSEGGEEGRVFAVRVRFAQTVR